MLPLCELCDEQSWLEKMVGNGAKVASPVDETMTCRDDWGVGFVCTKSWKSR